MKEITRRNFLGKSLAIGAGLGGGLTLAKNTSLHATPGMITDDISIAQWALVGEIRKGEWKTLDFAKIAREVFDINGIEFVNTLFEVPTYRYLNQLKKNADDYGVKMVLIMVDDEGEFAAPTKEERKQTVINHRKWIDIAHYLGCHSIRTNCRPRNTSFEDGLNWAEESYNYLLEYAVPAKVCVVIENHGTLSDDPDFLVALVKRINNLYFGLYPDWKGKIPYEFTKKTIPYATGVSARNQATDEETIRLAKLCHDSGYRGFYGIESSGREGIKRCKMVLEKALFGKE
ncbi:sugar phosphate isomerase/epimerase family protein [candidate division KSB1 bacterium]